MRCLKQGLGALVSLWAASTFAAELSVTLSAQSNADLVTFSAAVSSTYEVTGLTVEVEGHSAVATKSGTIWSATIDVTQLAYGQHVATAIATDVHGTTASGSTTLFIDRPPRLEVLTPGLMQVARGSAHLDFKCTDDGPGPCSVSAYVYGPPFNVPHKQNGVFAANGTGAIDTSFPVSCEWAESRLYVELVAVDDSGQSTTVGGHVYVESSPNLAQQTAVTGTIADVDGTRVLFQVSDGTPTGGTWNILDTSTGETVAVGSGDRHCENGSLLFIDYVCSSGTAWLTPSGAAWTTHAGSLVWSAADGGLSRATATAVRSSRFHAAYPDLEARQAWIVDLASSESQRVEADDFALSADEAIAVRNANAIFWGTSAKGLTEIYAEDGGGPLGDLQVDSNVVAVRRVPTSSSTDQILLLTDAGVEVVEGVRSGTPFRLSKGRLAFALQTAEQSAIALRDTDGGVSRLTYWDEASVPLALGEDGTVLYQHANATELVGVAVAPTVIASTFAHFVWRSGGWTIMEGNASFAISLDAGAPSCSIASDGGTASDAGADPDGGSFGTLPKTHQGCSSMEGGWTLAFAAFVLALGARSRRRNFAPPT